MMEIFINFIFLIMKQKMKFIVAVFGVTLAIFGSMNSNATATIRCNGSTGGCVKVQSPDGSSHWLVGTKSVSVTIE